MSIAENTTAQEMSKPLVLITGATGHIGFRTLTTLLQAGYHARISSRKLAQAEKLKQTGSIKPYEDSIEFIEVSDFLADGAFDEAVKDVEYILHLASPIPDPSLKGDVRINYINPAVQGTIGILKSALKSSSVKRVVITSSVAVLAPKSGATVVGLNDFAPIPDPAIVPDDPKFAYRASKILAHHNSLLWMEKNKPSFDLVYVLPAYVQGRNELVTKKENVHNGSNDVMMDLVLGAKDPAPRYADTVLVDDVARVEVAALNKERVIASPGQGIVWNDVNGLVEKNFPEAVKSGILPLGGEQGSMQLAYDVNYAEKACGLEFAGLEQQVKSLAGQYVELASK